MHLQVVSRSALKLPQLCLCLSLHLSTSALAQPRCTDRHPSHYANTALCCFRWFLSSGLLSRKGRESNNYHMKTWKKKKKKEKYEKAEEDLCHLWGPQIWVLLVKPTVHWTPLLWLPHINKLHCLAFLFFPSNICITYRHSADRPEECEIKCLFNAYLPYSMSGCNTDKLFGEN